MKLRATAPLTTNQRFIEKSKRNPIQKRKRENPPKQQGIPLKEKGISKKQKPLHKRKNKGKKPKWVPRQRIRKAEEQVALANIQRFVAQQEPELLRFLVWGLEEDTDFITYNELRQTCIDNGVTGKMMEDWRNRYAAFVTENLHPVWEKSMDIALNDLRGTVLEPSYQPTQALFMKHLQKMSSDRITVVTESVRDSIAYLLGEKGGVQGLSAVKTAQFIRPYIGLNRPQTIANKNFYDTTLKNLRENNPTMSKEAAEERARFLAKIKAEKQHRYRATMIARTELAQSYNVAHHLAVEDATGRGLLGDMVKLWCTSDGERMCAECGRMEGEVREVKELFSCGLLYPTLHPHCMCVVLYEDRFLHPSLGSGNSASRLTGTSRDLPSGSNTGANGSRTLEGSSGVNTGSQNGGKKDLGISENLLNSMGNGGTMNTDSKDGKITFVPAGTTKEAEAYLKGILKHSQVNYGNCDVYTANTWNEGIVNALNQFPELSERLNFVGEYHARNEAIKKVAFHHYFVEATRDKTVKTFDEASNRANNLTEELMVYCYQNSFAYAESLPLMDHPILSKFSGVVVNDRYGNDYSSFTWKLADDSEALFHPIECNSVQSILTHEIGHQLDDMLGLQEKKIIQQLFDSRTKEQLTLELSEYSWNNKPSLDSELEYTTQRYAEMIAEAWAEFLHNPEPRGLAKEIGIFIERTYEEWQKGVK